MPSAAGQNSINHKKTFYLVFVLKGANKLSLLVKDILTQVSRKKYVKCDFHYSVLCPVIFNNVFFVHFPRNYVIHKIICTFE
jgi:hypothetical protein